MTHPNRPLHRRDVESGVIDQNPYPQDIKPERLELNKSIDLLTRPVINESEGEDVLEGERAVRYPTFSVHGKSGNLHIDRDGTYRLVNCTINSLSYEHSATVILINCRVASITGKVEGDVYTVDPRIRIILIDSKLERVADARYFFLSLHGKTRWDGGLENCQFGNVRLLQSINWMAADNLKNCEDMVFSVAMTDKAKVIPVGDSFAKNCKRIRFQWHHTDLEYSSGNLFDNCSDMLSQHHGCTINAGTHLAFKCKTVVVVAHGSKLKTVEWIFNQTDRPTLSAMSSTIETAHPTRGGMFKECGTVRCHLGSRTLCKTGSILTGEYGALTVSHAKVEAPSSLIDAQNSSVNLQDAELISTAGPFTVKLAESRITTDDLRIKSTTLCYDLTDTTVELKAGRIQGNSGAIKLKNCSTRLKLAKLSSSGMDVSMEGGSLTMEGGTTAMSVEVKNAAHLCLSDAKVGLDILVKNTASTELHGNTVAGKLDVQGGRLQSAGNTFGGSGTVDVGIGELCGDTFGGVLTVTGIVLIGNVNAPDVINKGFMLINGGTGSSLVPVTRRGWHVTESMDFVLDETLWESIGKDMNTTIGSNNNRTIGQNLTETAGQNSTLTAGANITENAGSTIAETAGSLISNSAASIVHN